MDHRVPRVGTVISILLAVLALITFLFLNSRFEGPDPTAGLGDPFQLTAKFEDTKKLPTKQPVLYKGIPIGRVNNVAWDAEENVSVVTFTLDDGFEIYTDATLQIGERSLLGDPYLNLVSRGSEGSTQLTAGDVVANTDPSVNFDEALDFLDEKGQESVKSLIHDVGVGVAPEGNGEALNGTVGGTSRLVQELTGLTGSLKGHEAQIAELVSGASTVLGELGDQEDSIRTIVGSGRATLDAIAANTDSLDQALQEVPRVLDSGTQSLEGIRPLLSDARVLASDIRAAAPGVEQAFTQGKSSVGSVVDDLSEVIPDLRPLRKEAEPVLGRAAPMLKNLVDLVIFAGPTARILTPGLDYLTPRVDAISGLYALVAAAARGEDKVGHYLRVGATLDPIELLDAPPADANCDPKTQNDSPNQGYCRNAYPGPGDALDPQPFTGKYPRIVPCTVPPRSTPTKPCK